MTTIGGALTQQLRQKLFDRLDADSSQGLGLDELNAADPARPADAFAKIFAALDADQDGKIGRVEIAAAPALSLGADTLLAASEPGDAVAALFQRADVDGDAKLSNEEMEAEKALRRAANLDAGYISGPMFTGRDVNGDGALDPSEITALGDLNPVALKPVFFDEMPADAQARWRKEFGRAPDIHTPEEKQRIRDQLAADQTERASGPAGTVKFLERELGGLRGDAAAQFSALPMTRSLSSRLLAQILSELDPTATT
jgi:Ca2+-binding EF-hand superfamily protein